MHTYLLYICHAADIAAVRYRRGNRASVKQVTFPYTRSIPHALHTLFAYNDLGCTRSAGPLIANTRIPRLCKPNNYTEKLIKLTQGKLRGDLGGALPFLPGLFIDYASCSGLHSAILLILSGGLTVSPLIT